MTVIVRHVTMTSHIVGLDWARVPRSAPPRLRISSVWTSIVVLSREQIRDRTIAWVLCLPSRSLNEVCEFV